MKCYIISYDLRYSRDYSSLYSAIKSYGTWAKITDSTWAVTTQLSASQVRDHLVKHIDSDDRLFVIRSGQEAAWINAKANDEWLKKYLVY